MKATVAAQTSHNGPSSAKGLLAPASNKGTIFNASAICSAESNLPQSRVRAPENRFSELDSLRGMAAGAVVVNHWIFLFGPITNHDGTKYISGGFKVMELSPLHLLAAGHEAVLIFFLLSGFVLTLGAGSKFALASYGRYLLKRASRLYLPYVGALILACLANAKWHGQLPSLSDWFNHVWQLPPDRDSILWHLTLIGSFNFSRYNTALWSLVYEARISLIFPFLVFGVRRLRGQFALGLALCLSLAAQVAISRFGHSSELITLHYMAIFIVGITAALHRQWAVETIRLAGPKAARRILAGTLLVLSMDQLLKHVPGPLHSLELLTDIPGIAAGALILILSLSFEPLMHVLRHRLAIALGYISYSLYLVHATILFALVHSLWNKCAHWLIALAYLVLSLTAATLFYVLVERPCIKLSRSIGSWGRLNLATQSA